MPQPVTGATARIDRVVTFARVPSDHTPLSENANVWLVGDDAEVVVVDPAHDLDAILRAIAGRHVVAVVETHGHDHHASVVHAVREATGAPLLLHHDDVAVWKATVPTSPDGDLATGQVVDVAGVRMVVLHTPGHTPGAVCLYVPELGAVLTGETLLRGGPGATGLSYSHFGTIIASIRDHLLTLPPDTRVLPGRGDETTIGDEAAHLDEWIARGH